VEELREILRVKVIFLPFFLYLCLSLFNVSLVVLVLRTLCSVLRAYFRFLVVLLGVLPSLAGRPQWRLVASPCCPGSTALAVGQAIGHSSGSVRSAFSAARMNKVVEKVEQVNRLVETGITVNGMFEPVLPLTQPATSFTLTNGTPIH